MRSTAAGRCKRSCLSWDSSRWLTLIVGGSCMVRIKKSTWRTIYSVAAALTPPICTVVFLGELSKCVNAFQILSLYILGVAVYLLFLPSYLHCKTPFLAGWIISLISVTLLIAASEIREPLGVVLTVGVALMPPISLALNPIVSKLKNHLLVRSLCVCLIVLIRVFL